MTAARRSASSYGMNYDFPSAHVHVHRRRPASPFSNRVAAQRACRSRIRIATSRAATRTRCRRDPPFDAQFPGLRAVRRDRSGHQLDARRSRGTSPSSGSSARRGRGRRATSAATLDRLWGGVHINPGVFMGLGPCTIDGRERTRRARRERTSNQRRMLFLQNPALGQGLGLSSTAYADVGTQTYRGLKLSFRRARRQRREPQRQLHAVALRGRHRGRAGASAAVRRAATSTRTTRRSIAATARRTARQIGNVSVGAQTPQFANTALRAGRVRLAGVGHLQRALGRLAQRSRPARDIAGTGIIGQRVNQVSDDPYGDKTLDQLPESGRVRLPGGGHVRQLTRANSIEGPGFWTVDMALSRLVSVSADADAGAAGRGRSTCSTTSTGAIPATNFDAGTFGRITTSAGDPRIMQFGVKYGF